MSTMCGSTTTSLVGNQITLDIRSSLATALKENTVDGKFLVGSREFSKAVALRDVLF